MKHYLITIEEMLLMEVHVIPSSEFMGEINGIQTYDHNFNNSRMDSSLLNAFKNNPYTKSLNSVA